MTKTNKYKCSQVMMKDKNGIITMFNSITMAAGFAGVNAWTMSLKMQVFGYFEDKNGNKYFRMDKMKTKNEYYSASPKMVKEQHRKRKSAEKVEKIEQKEEKKEENIVVNTNDPAIEAINDKIVSILKKAGVYEEIQKLSNAIKKLSK